MLGVLIGKVFFATNRLTQLRLNLCMSLLRSERYNNKMAFLCEWIARLHRENTDIISEKAGEIHVLRPKFRVILLMAEILHQLIGSLSHYL